MVQKQNVTCLVPGKPAAEASIAIEEFPRCVFLSSLFFFVPPLPKSHALSLASPTQVRQRTPQLRCAPGPQGHHEERASATARPRAALRAETQTRHATARALTKVHLQARTKPLLPILDYSTPTRRPAPCSPPLLLVLAPLLLVLGALYETHATPRAQGATRLARPRQDG